MTWIGQSYVEINRDAILIIAKNSELPLRENLTEEELKKYATPALINHLE